ncbi:MAG: hypothetical protein AAF547_14875, partial [Actinomycetota bacterium]
AAAAAAAAGADADRSGGSDGTGDDGVGDPSVDPVSPEGRVAMAAFADARPRLADRLAGCGSGRQLIDQGHAGDVTLAAELDASTVVPALAGPELVDRA